MNWHRFRALGPSVAHASPAEAFRAGLGALAGLLVAGLFVLSPAIDLRMGMYLVPVFGSVSFLLFAVPNSPLAQPWPVVVGNTIGALIGVVAIMTVDDPVLRVGLAVGFTVTATILCRAVHPPAGAVAMTAALNPDVINHLGFLFALAPIATGNLILILTAAAYARLTGRRYPFRQFDEPNRHGTADPAPAQRLGLSEKELTDILSRYRQSFNLGTEDLARLIGAAELQAATHQTGPLTASDIMSRNLVTVAPDTPLVEVADLFRQHRFTSIPVVKDDSVFLGVIFQIHLISRAREDALRLSRGFAAALKRLLDHDVERTIRAEEIMGVAVPRAASDTPIGTLLPLLAEGDVDAVPILDRGRIVGIVTRTDLIAGLARRNVQASRSA
jgi:CBS domain-containing membrane protein